MMVTVNFLQIHESERFLCRMAYGISTSVLRPVLMLSVIGVISLFAHLIQANEVRGLDREITSLQHKRSLLSMKLVGRRTALHRLRQLIALDSTIFEARNSGARIANMHATIANLLHPHTQLTSIVQGSGPIILAGNAPTYAAVGFSLGQLTDSFGSGDVGLESARSSEIHRSGDGVSFILHVRIPGACCQSAR